MGYVCPLIQLVEDYQRFAFEKSAAALNLEISKWWHLEMEFILIATFSWTDTFRVESGESGAPLWSSGKHTQELFVFAAQAPLLIDFLREWSANSTE